MVSFGVEDPQGKSPLSKAELDRREDISNTKMSEAIRVRTGEMPEEQYLGIDRKTAQQINEAPSPRATTPASSAETAARANIARADRLQKEGDY